MSAPTGDLDDVTLVVRAREGDVAAFELLVRRYQTPVYKLAVRMLADRSAAEDVTQDTFLTAWRRLPEIRADAAISGWLFRVATNRCLNLLRSRRSSAELDPELPDRASNPPERQVENATAIASLAQVLQRLTPEQRACWLLREIHGLSYDEIAATLDTTPTAVRGRIARARVELTEAMRPWR